MEAMNEIDEWSVIVSPKEELAIEDKLQLLLDTLEAIKDSSAPTFALQLKIMTKIEDLVDQL